MNRIAVRMSLLMSTIFVAGQMSFAQSTDCAVKSCVPACHAKVDTLTLGTAFKSGHILSDFSEKFKEIVEARTHGKVFVAIDAGTKTEEQVNLDCSNGVVDMQATGGYPLQVFADKYFFFNCPYVIKDYDHFLRVWNGSLGQAAQAEILANGNMMSIGTVYRGFRQFTSNTAIAGTADFVGLKLRLPSVPVWTAVWSALEVTPVTVPLTGLYQALADGTADASEGDLAQISSYKLYEVQSQLSMTNHLCAIGWIEINKTAFDRFKKRDQHVILEAATAASEYATQKMKDNESTILAELLQNGMVVTNPDADAIRAKAKPAVEALFLSDWPVTTWDEVLAQ